MENGQSSAPKSTPSRRRIVWIAAAIALLIAAAVTVAWMLRPAEPPASAPAPTVAARATASPSPTPTPTPTPTPSKGAKEGGTLLGWPAR